MAVRAELANLEGRVAMAARAARLKGAQAAREAMAVLVAPGAEGLGDIRSESSTPA